MEDAYTIQVLMMNTLGLSVLSQTLRTAAKFVYLKPSSRNTITKECYYFVQGTGLEILLNTYGLFYDPENIRINFNYYVKRKFKHDSKNNLHSLSS